MIDEIHHGDCLDLLPLIPDGSVDMILCDLPYGVTKNKWDSVIDLDRLWAEYLRIIKPNGAIVLTAQDKFAARLMLSQEKIHRYNLIWDKELTSGFLNANRQPLRRHEDILVFYKRQPTYNPQKVKGRPNHSRGAMATSRNDNYGRYTNVDNHAALGDMKHPTSIVSFQKPHPSKAVHPTEKPVELFEWLIRTYTDEGEVVLDNCIGSGTTAVAAIRTGRRYIGMEQDADYHRTAVERCQAEYDRLRGAPGDLY